MGRKGKEETHLARRDQKMIREKREEKKGRVNRKKKKETKIGFQKARRGEGERKGRKKGIYSGE